MFFPIFCSECGKEMPLNTHVSPDAIAYCSNRCFKEALFKRNPTPQQSLPFVFVSVILGKLSSYKTKDVLDVYQQYNDGTLARPNGDDVNITAIVDKSLVPAIAKDLMGIGVNFHVHAS